MLRRKYHKGHRVNSKLLFYAPLTTDKYPVHTADGDNSLYYEGSCFISNNELCFTGTSSKMGVGYNQRLPLTGFTISAFHTRALNSGHEFSFSASAHSSVVNWTLLLSHTQGNRSFVDSLGIQMVLRNAVPPINVKTFETVSMIKNPNGTYTTKIYINGVLMAENTRENAGLDNYIEKYGDSFIGLGLWGKDSDNGFVGYISQYTCFEGVLSDEYILDLYRKKGIPEGF